MTIVNGNAIDVLEELEALAKTVRAKAAEMGVNIHVAINIHDYYQAHGDVAALVAGAQALNWARNSEWAGGKLIWYLSPEYGATVTIYNREG